MTGAKLGSLVGAVGGLVFVLANAGALPGPWPLVLQVTGIVAFALVVAAVLRAPVIGGGVEPSQRQLRDYGFTVLAEVVAILAGTRILVGVLDLPTATLPWVATVVGLHFLVFARIFREPVFWWLGGAVTGCGVAGLALAAASAPEATVSTVGGVVPGAVLLASVGWSAAAGSRRAGAESAPG